MKDVIKAKKHLQTKLVKEGLTKKEKEILDELKVMISEAPIDYEGPERMDPGIERKISQKQTPYHGQKGIPNMDRDFLELIASKRFKDSVDKVARYLGDTSSLQGRNPVGRVMSMAMGGLYKIASIEYQNKDYLEKLAVDLVKKEMGIPEGAFLFDAKLVHGGMGAAEGMRTEPEQPKPEDIQKAFKHKEELEDFADEFEKFNLERAKRRFLNSLIQGAAFKGGHMYVLVAEELEKIDPELLELYGVTQSLMEHLYWIMPDMEGMAASGGGQLGQSSVDETTDPPTIKARAGTFPLLVHELVKGLHEVFFSHGLPDDPEQQSLVMGMEDTLPAEIWDSRFGPVFWELFQESYPEEVFEEDQKHIQHYLITRFSRIDAKEFFKLIEAILSKKPEGNKFMKKLVDEIVRDLKQREAEDILGKEDDDDDDDLSGINLDDLY